jgi:hypothetical protein
MVHTDASHGAAATLSRKSCRMPSQHPAGLQDILTMTTRMIRSKSWFIALVDTVCRILDLPLPSEPVLPIWAPEPRPTLRSDSHHIIIDIAPVMPVGLHHRFRIQ